jgi:hypothetical protein
MAERYLQEKGIESLIDNGALILISALALFAFIGAFLTAPMRRK